MPRRAQASSSKSSKKLKQKSLEAFFPPSSPITVSSSPSPSSSPRASRPETTTRKKEHRVMKKRGADKRGRVAEDGLLETEDDNNSSSDPGGIRFESDAAPSPESDEDEAKNSPRKSSLSQKKKQRRMADSEEEQEVIEIESSDDQEVGVPITWKGKSKDGKRSRARVQSDSDEEPQPRRRKLIKGVRPPTPEEDLIDEVDESKIIDSRLRSRDKKSSYLKNLEKLKKKKRGESVASASSKSEADSDSDEYAAPFSHARPDSEDKDNDNGPEEVEDEELSSFIEDDGDTVSPALPAEFSMNTYQDLVHHFKIICQLFVHLAVQQLKNRRAFMERSLRDEYFFIPLQIARRKIEGMRDSLVASSVWRSNFKKTLTTYPEFETIGLDFAMPGCDACRLGGRLSTLVGRVRGEPYDRTTFRPLKRGNESSELDDSNEGGDRKKKEFHLGRFCAKRTRVWHSFTHWEYALFKTLSGEVEELRQRQDGKSRVFVRVAYAGGTEPPDDLTDGDRIMSWLDERGIIATEWQKIKKMMEDATHLEIAAKRGDDD
ncbi:hypothetical protein NM688_g538 [Phlebia brevispora]|uniref:Uncharacterized protein n=1 Tax=Phlebia brevispora TaxID=194682 RepID=A0ACC1TE85_9APHY|nr:hypothetical protein NM688_g538 [Phlebia brevispora]